MRATKFEFVSYKFNPLEKRVVFRYTTHFEDRESLEFEEIIILPSTPNSVPKALLEKVLQNLHLILGISYYKAYCATEVVLPYQLSKQEAGFWNVIYKKGLGEFFYQNKLNPNRSPKFPYRNNVQNSHLSSEQAKLKIHNSQFRALVGIGGGKDSIVVAELLKEHGFDFTSFLVKTGEDKIVQQVIELIDCGQLKIERQLDPKILQSHQYNGHVPISAIYAFLGLLSAVFYNYSYIIVGNEHSSNFGNIIYKGLEVNHQWSKSYEFERLLQSHIATTITPDIWYFSLLRSFDEIRIAKLFTQYPKYFPIFSSCNKNFKIASSNNAIGRLSPSGVRWCGKCAKCVFVFTLLSAFLSEKKLVSIFGKNLYRDKDLLPLFKDILGLGTMKPFDCVGTFEESQTALCMARGRFKDSFIVRQIGNRVKIFPKVFLINKETSVPEQFKLLGMDKALIVGFGREGKITKQYLKKYYPRLKIGIADVKEGRDYLKKQTEYDIAIKTPGIHKSLVTIPYTSATNIFFGHIKGKYPVIGITGSKGKSTTSSLIFHILKTAKKNAVLLGNIGQPMLEALLKPIAPNTLFVLELSSYQLDDIAFSPDVSVVTNLFPEHMDFHGNLKSYYEAKKNIIAFQNENNIFIHNPDNSKTISWLKGYSGKAIAFSKNLPLPAAQIPLLGQHNLDNVRAAISVAKVFNIKNEIIAKAIRTFKGLKHRLENIGTYRGITFYDDAISTTPDSTIMAIKSIKNIDTILLGGQDRGYDFSNLERIIRKQGIKNVVLFPDSGKKMLSSKRGFNILETSSMKEAVEFAYNHTRKGGVCLLSCASPSYSLWKNFEEKGEQFKLFVKKLNSKS